MKTNTDYGALYVGDIVIIPGRDIAAEVIGFDFNADPDARPDNCVVVTDMGRLEGVLSTPIARASKPHASPVPGNWRRWFSTDDDYVDIVANTGALA